MARISTFLIALVAFLAPQSVLAASPVGQWQVKTGEARYIVSPCGAGGLCAKLVWLSPDARTEANLALLNHYVVKGAQPVADDEWSGDLVFAGHSYSGTIKLVSSNVMTLKGCSGILCKTYEFVRL